MPTPCERMLYRRAVALAVEGGVYAPRFRYSGITQEAIANMNQVLVIADIFCKEPVAVAKSILKYEKKLIDQRSPFVQ
jgi:hypothetical protein